ncbi:hypothetical protein SP15_291 [Bacillus phage SP-15]|uniref:Uncharacterized protein n=1 Tax=Bacillus phage SP-15 TaxID=1792032 RepID=A0A127AWM1_9CAUD|nr:hypothetical protein SP15_291 [Bacillus phage SP-15]AMM45099.1 hypothetical protein SP15_291 [Bacillus phage SP-15]
MDSMKIVQTLSNQTPEELAKRILITSAVEGRISAMKQSIEDYRLHIEKGISLALDQMDFFIPGRKIIALADFANNWRKGEIVEITEVSESSATLDGVASIDKMEILKHSDRYKGDSNEEMECSLLE